MAEPHPKRLRNNDDDLETSKRHKNTHTHFVAIDKHQENTQDLSDFFTNIPYDPFLDLARLPEPDPDHNLNSNSNSNTSVKEELVDDDDEKESVIRHLLEASDDELGIPSRVDSAGGEDEVAGGGYGDFPVALWDGLWELEDEAANYYTLLQSELFMQ